MRHVLTVELPSAGIRRIKASHQIEKRGFTSTIRSDQCSNAMPFDFKVIDIHCRHTAEFTGYIICDQNRIRLVNSRIVLHEFQIFRDFVTIGRGDQRLTFGGFGGPLGQIMERYARLWNRLSCRRRNIRCIRHGKPTPFGHPTNLAV